MKKIKKMNFEDMKVKFREHRNFLKLSARLVDYGYMCTWLPVDDEGADFIAVHCITNDVIKIQLKGRICVDTKYYDKNIFMAFPKTDKESSKEWVIVPHDDLAKIFIKKDQWEKKGSRSSGKVPEKIWNDVKIMSIVEPISFDY